MGPGKKSSGTPLIERLLWVEGSPVDNRCAGVQHGAMSAVRLRIYLVAGAGSISLVSAAASAVLVPAEHGVAVALAWVGLGVLPALAVAVWLVHRRPDHPQARRLLLMAAAWSVSVGIEGPTRTLYQHLGPGRWLLFVDLAGQYATLLSAVVATVLVASYPDGTVERSWHQVLLRIVWAQLLVPPLALLTARHVVIDPFLVPTGTPGIANPLALSDLIWLQPALQVAGSGVCGVALGVIVLLGRHVGAGASARSMRPLVYVVLSGLTIAAVDVVLALLGVPRTSPSRTVLSFVVLVVLMLIPATVVWGVLRWRLFDIEPVVRRSAVLGVLSLGIASVYAALAAAPGLALGNAVPVQVAVVVTIIAALAFQPARRRLELLADRLVFGRRVNRYQIVSSFGASLERTADLSDLLPRLAETVQVGLGARWVLVSLQGHDGVRLEAPHGFAGERSGEAELAQTLRRGTEVLGQIECGPKPGGYDKADRELLATLAAQSATAIANVRLTAELTERFDELSRSRARIVAAQDAERRRIERNIHDGVQQHVVALITNLRLARNLFDRGQLQEANLAHLQRDVHELLVDLRELALGIHPPVLSDNGLVAAVEARASRLTLDVDVVADERMRTVRLGQDVEGAAYFVICEALTNVVKHAQAATASIELTAGDGILALEVRDDGTGIGRTGSGHGQGLISLRDRVEALGGQLSIDSTGGMGTRVRAELPIGETP